MSKLFAPLKLREITFRNRIFVSPMCQYSSENGMPNDWHLVHLGSRAVGGAGLVMTEGTAVSPEGRITPLDSGIWSDEHIAGFSRLASIIKQNGAVAGLQIAHAGRKASTAAPWHGGKLIAENAGGWQPVAASAIRFSEDYAVPREMSAAEIEQVVRDFADAAKRGIESGFELIEIHAAHGYLLHGFLSPLSNTRTDAYGGNLENRARFLLEVTKAVRAVVPDNLPLFVRISATDWADGGFDLEQAIQTSKWLKAAGVDLIDASSGGLVPKAKIPVAPGYQVPLAAAIRKETGIATGAVGMITEAQQAEQIIVCDYADAVFLAREFLRDPYFPLHAAKELGVEVPYPVQYERAK